MRLEGLLSAPSRLRGHQIRPKRLCCSDSRGTSLVGTEVPICRDPSWIVVNVDASSERRPRLKARPIVENPDEAKGIWQRCRA